jgi:hypothetical protein
MRIDFFKLYQLFDYSKIPAEFEISFKDWTHFGKILESKTERKQLKLF